MSCNFCENAIFENYGFDDGEKTIGLAAGSYRFPKEKQFRYCPACGEPLSEPQPLTLDELREMDGRPVWSGDCWHLVWLDDDKNVWLQRPMTLGTPSSLGEDYRECLAQCIGAEKLTIYRRPPKEDKNHDRKDI